VLLEHTRSFSTGVVPLNLTMISHATNDAALGRDRSYNSRTLTRF